MMLYNNIDYNNDGTLKYNNVDYNNGGTQKYINIYRKLTGEIF